MILIKKQTLHITLHMSWSDGPLWWSIEAVISESAKGVASGDRGRDGGVTDGRGGAGALRVVDPEHKVSETFRLQENIIMLWCKQLKIS